MFCFASVCEFKIQKSPFQVKSVLMRQSIHLSKYPLWYIFSPHHSSLIYLVVSQIILYWSNYATGRQLHLPFFLLCVAFPLCKDHMISIPMLTSPGLNVPQTQLLWHYLGKAQTWHSAPPKMSVTYLKELKLHKEFIFSQTQSDGGWYEIPSADKGLTKCEDQMY